MANHSLVLQKELQERRPDHRYFISLGISGMSNFTSGEVHVLVFGENDFH